MFEYCPLMSYAKEYQNSVECFDRMCALAGTPSGKCLIRTFLEKQIQSLQDQADLRAAAMLQTRENTVESKIEPEPDSWWPID